MGTVLAFRRTHRASSSKPDESRQARPRGSARFGWWLGGALAATVAAVLSPLRWPARIALVFIGAAGFIGATVGWMLSDPTNWTMVTNSAIAFFGSIALWHGGDAAVKGARAQAKRCFAKAARSDEDDDTAV